MSEQVVLKRPSACIRADTNVHEVGIGGRAVEIGLRTAGVDTGGGSHAHAGGAVLVTVIGVVGPVGFSNATSRARRVAMEVAHSIVSGDEFLIEAGVFVVHTRVNHRDVDVLAREAQVPCADGIER